MEQDINKQYLQNKQRRVRNICHWRLAVNQMIQCPLLCILLLPIVALTVFFWMKFDFVITMFDVPKIILPVYVIVIKSIGVLIPLILVWGLIDVIGTLTAREDEVSLQMAFKENELRNGSPILMYKRKDKKTKRTIRKWYSPIPKKVWIERQGEIAHAMNIRYIEKIRYSGKLNGNRIVMYSLEGKKASIKGKLVYDMDLEKDMEIID